MPQSGRVAQGFQWKDVACEMVVAEIAGLRTGCENELVEADRPVLGHEVPRSAVDGAHAIS